MLDDRSYMRQPAYAPQKPTWLILIIALVVTYICQALIALSSNGGSFNSYFYLSSGSPPYAWFWQLLTFQILHGGPIHLAFNCLAIYFFGQPVEAAFGGRKLLGIFFGTGVVAGIFQLVFALVFQSKINVMTCGASAGTAGLIGVYAALNWNVSAPFGVMFIPIYIKGKFIALITGGLSLLSLLTPGGNVAHAAHLGGLLAGLGYMRFGVLAEERLRNWYHARPVPMPPRRQRDRELVKTHSAKRSMWETKKADPVVVEELPPGEFISREVDPILDKISAHGIQSLTERERQILEKARAKMAKRS